MSAFTGGLARARELLIERFGHAAFRAHQVRVLGPLLAGRSVLAVLPTGAGKSLCYQLPALMAPGLTLVVSPLISLMQDQVARLRRRGIAAAYLNSLLRPEQRRIVLDAALHGRLKLLYCAPERLGALVPRLVRAAQPVSLLAVDEAHCIVEWGNEFRPVYRRLGEYRYRLQRPPTIALTGSATGARWSWGRAPSEWASTSQTCASCSTGARRPPSRRITRKREGPGGTAGAPPASCCGGPRTSRGETAVLKCGATSKREPAAGVCCSLTSENGRRGAVAAIVVE